MRAALMRCPSPLLGLARAEEDREDRSRRLVGRTL